jgi:hypothetical protein
MEDDMKSPTFVSVAMLLVLVPAGVGLAQTAPSPPDPGAVALEDLGAFGPDGAEVDVDLQGPMVQLVAAATAESDPEVADLLRSIRRIRVLSGAPGGEWIATRDRFERVVADLEGVGWNRIVRVREDEELVYVLVLPAGERFAGMTVLVLDGRDEVALVNIAGDIDPASIGRLSSVLDDVPDLEDLAEVER